MQKVVSVLGCGGYDLEQGLNQAIRDNQNRRIEALYPFVQYEDNISVLILFSDENPTTQESQVRKN